MKISNILIVFIILFSIACTGKREHGHEHKTEEHGHPHTESSEDHGHGHEEQEEFSVKDDSIQAEKDSPQHMHDGDNEHHDH